ncbi:hypothetical protein L1049_020225 [Liquidambar formosana]|uniref:Uncharacterized protein n=1 Tax=Liquidambar formosana TaxID=63359 RepID=A0AAP0SCU1_LIQFO
MPVDSSHDETPGQQMDAVQEQADASPRHDMDVDAEKEDAIAGMNVTEARTPDDVLTKPEVVQETAEYDGYANGDATQASSGNGEMVNSAGESVDNTADIVKAKENLPIMDVDISEKPAEMVDNVANSEQVITKLDGERCVIVKGGSEGMLSPLILQSKSRRLVRLVGHFKIRIHSSGFIESGKQNDSDNIQFTLEDSWICFPLQKVGLGELSRIQRIWGTLKKIVLLFAFVFVEICTSASNKEHSNHLGKGFSL